MYLAAIFFLAIGILAVIGIALILMLIAGIVLLVVGITKKRKYRQNGMVKKYPKVCIVLGTILTIIPLCIFGFVLIPFIIPTDHGYNPDTYDPHTASVHEEDEYIEEVYVKEVLRCLNEEDVDGFKELFSDYAISQMDDLDEQIQAAMEIFDGKAISYEHVHSGRAGHVAYGYYKEKSLGIKIENVVTDTGKSYNVYFSVWDVYDGSPNREGMYKFSITEFQESDGVNDGDTLIDIGNINS